MRYSQWSSSIFQAASSLILQLANTSSSVFRSLRWKQFCQAICWIRSKDSHRRNCKSQVFIKLLKSLEVNSPLFYTVLTNWSKACHELFYDMRKSRCGISSRDEMFSHSFTCIIEGVLGELGGLSFRHWSITVVWDSYWISRLEVVRTSRMLIEYCGLSQCRESETKIYFWVGVEMFLVFVGAVLVFHCWFLFD